MTRRVGITRRSIGNAASLNNSAILAARCGDGGVVVAAGDPDGDGLRRGAVERRHRQRRAGDMLARCQWIRLGLIQRVAPYPGARVEGEIAVSADQRRRGRGLENRLPAVDVVNR